MLQHAKAEQPVEAVRPEWHRKYVSLDDEHVLVRAVRPIIGIHRIAVVERNHRCARSRGLFREPAGTAAHFENEFPVHVTRPMRLAEKALFRCWYARMAVVFRAGG